MKDFLECITHLSTFLEIQLCLTLVGWPGLIPTTRWHTPPFTTLKFAHFLHHQAAISSRDCY